MPRPPHPRRTQALQFWDSHPDVPIDDIAERYSVARSTLDTWQRRRLHAARAGQEDPYGVPVSAAVLDRMEERASRHGRPRGTAARQADAPAPAPVAFGEVAASDLPPAEYWRRQLDLAVRAAERAVAADSVRAAREWMGVANHARQRLDDAREAEAEERARREQEEIRDPVELARGLLERLPALLDVADDLEVARDVQRTAAEWLWARER